MAQEPKKSAEDGIAVAEIEALQQRIAARQLAPDDWARLGKLLGSFLALVQMLEHPKLKLRQIRKQLFGQREKPPTPSPPAAAQAETSGPSEVLSVEAEMPTPPAEKESIPSAAGRASKRKSE